MKFTDSGDGLRRTLLLNYPGCSSIKAALEQELKNRIPPKTYLVEDKVSLNQTFTLAIEMISKHLGDFDIDTMNQKRRIELSKMALETKLDVVDWTNAWLSVSVKEDLNSAR